MMKKKCYIAFIFSLFAVGLLAQEWNIIDTENLLTKKEKIAIERSVQYQLDFFNRLFSEKTVNRSDIKFVVAKNLAEYLYLQSKHELLQINSSGFFSPKDSTVVVFKKCKNRFLRTCYHELNHAFLYVHVDSNHIPPAWFIEGLATYYTEMTYDKKKITHRVNSYYTARVKTLIALEDINLVEFVNWDYQKFSKESFAQDGYGYAIGYCMVLFMMKQCENKTFTIFRNLINEYSTIEVFDKYYSGGFSQFEKDFIAYFGK
ncbi:MAG: hypothetical protein FWE63_04915 [Bacteroidales bacterium]|nr:hypothetical protein [Bacteroidales bacterium]